MNLNYNAGKHLMLNDGVEVYARAHQFKDPSSSPRCIYLPSFYQHNFPDFKLC